MLKYPPPQNSKRQALVNAKLFVPCVLSLFLLSACGGGGDNSIRSSTPTVFVPRSSPNINILPDDAGYAGRKSTAAAFPEFGASYAFTTTNGNRVSGNKYWLRMIKADAAYARGATGAGQIIAIVDTGIRDTHREFSDQEFSGSDKVTKVTQLGYSPKDEDKFHGTFVAALAVGNRNSVTDFANVNMHGVAFDASLHFTEIELGTSDGTYRPSRLENYSSRDGQSDATFYSNIITTARGAGAAIVNQSFGRAGAISQYSRAEVRSRLGSFAGALAQAGTADADKTIIVWAAGNAATQTLVGGGTPVFDSPEFGAGLGAYFPELQSHVLAVVALDEDGSIASYSNHCGIAKSFCLAAPGSNMVSAGFSGDDVYRVGLSGTSFAAPIVSGSLALLRQYFRRQLGNTELVTRLLATSNRNGIYANSAIYGHGLVDLDAATAPVGIVMTGLPGDPNSRPFTGSGITLSGAAFGSSLQSALAGVEVAGFDALGAPFFQSAANWITQPAQEHGGSAHREQRELPLAAAPSQNKGAKLSLGFNGNGMLDDARFSFADGWWLSYGDHGGRALGLYEQSGNAPDYPNYLTPDFQGNPNEPRYTDGAQRFNDPLAFAAPYLSLVRDGPGMGWSHRRAGGKRFGFALMNGTAQFDGKQNLGGERGIGALLDLTTDNGLSLQAGAVREGDGFLGARPQGALGQAQGTTTFIGANGDWTLGDDWHLLSSAYFGRTRPQVDDTGLLHDASTLTSSAFSLGAARVSMWRRNDWFGLRLSQSLRVEHGQMKLRLPAGRTKYGEVIHAEHQVNLAPTGRNLQAEATYQMPVAGGALKTSLGAEHHPQHDRTRDLRPFMSLSFERRF